MTGSAELRFKIQQSLYQNLESRHAAVASALLVGLRGGLDQDIRADFRESGLSHLLAISGLHMALFWGSIMALIRGGLACFPHFSSRYPSLKIATVAAMPFGVFYLVISGMPVSAVRAFMMLGLFMLAILMTRRGVTLHHVALAAIVILVIDPLQLNQPAFQMSFAAVFALVAGWMAITARRYSFGLPRFMKYLGGIMIGSVLAGSVTAPFVLHHFGVTSIWSIVANLAGMPLMAVIIMPFGALSLAALPFGLEAPFLEVMGWGIEMLLLIADYFGYLPFSRIAYIPPPRTVLYAFTLGLVLMVVLKSRGKLYSATILAIALLIWVNAPRPVATMTKFYHRSLAAISDGGDVYYSHKSATEFERSIITQPFGYGHGRYIGDASTKIKDVALVNHQNGKRIAMVWRKQQLKKACPSADLILVMRLLPTSICPNKLVTLNEIETHGGVKVYEEGGRFTLHFVDGTIKFME